MDGHDRGYKTVYDQMRAKTVDPERCGRRYSSTIDQSSGGVSVPAMHACY
jgi:hypothetical protein